MLYFNEITLTPAVATTIFFIAVVAGYQYRRLWKNEGARWKLWLSGLTSATCLLVLGFFPLEVPN